MTKEDQKEPESKKSNTLRNTVISAVVAILVALAASPGFFAWLEGAGKKADLSNEKADLAYKILRQQIEFMDKKMETQQSDIRELRSILLSSLSYSMEHVGKAAPSHEPESEPDPMPPMNILGLGDLTPPDKLFGPAPEQLPANLDAAMKAKAE